jgi:hypothetical protein
MLERRSGSQKNVHGKPIPDWWLRSAEAQPVQPHRSLSDNRYACAPKALVNIRQPSSSTFASTIATTIVPYTCLLEALVNAW